VSYQTGQQFGYALAAANFGQGAAADLAVASPGDDLGALANGSVEIFYGHSTGIDLATTARFGQATTGVRGDPDDTEGFGKALAAGNFGKGTQADLAVGVPVDHIGTIEDAGGVNVLFGSSSGIQAAGSQRWTQNSEGVAGQAKKFDAFGGSLAAGNMGRSPQADLAVGSPGEDVGGVGFAGAVNVIFGTSSGLSAAGDQYWSQASPGVVDSPSSTEGFGLSLTAANFGGSARADLAIASDERVGSVPFAGGVHVLYGTASGLTTSGADFFTQATPGIVDQPAQADGFGRALGAGNFGRGQYADLAVGVANEDRRGFLGAGAVQLIYGTPHGLKVRHAELLDQDSAQVEDVVESADGFGFSLTPRGSSLGVRFLP
jgi:hypothetical protein